MVALCGVALGSSGCGSKETAEESAGDPAASRVTIGLTLLADGEVEAGLEQLAASPDQPSKGKPPAWYAEAVDDLLQWRHLDEADSLLTLLGPVSGRPPAFVLRTAHVARLRGQPDEAIGLYQKVQGDAEQEVLAAVEMAQIHRAQEKYEEALAVARPYLEGEPDGGVLREIAVACLLDLGRAQEALDEVQQLPVGPTRAAMEGEAWLSLGQPDSAVTHLQVAMQLDPRSSRVRYLLGRAFLQTDQPTYSVQLLGPLAQGDPPYDDAQLYFSQALRATGNTARADSMLADYERVQAERELYELRFQGLLASKEGRLDDAVHHLRQALERDPDDGDLHNDIGTVLARQKKYEEAEVAFLKAKELMPRDIAVHTNLVRLYESMGDAARAEEARAHLAKLLEPIAESVPDDPR